MGTNIHRDASDYLVELVFERKDAIVDHNSSRRDKGCLLKRTAWSEIVSLFNRRFPLLDKSSAQLQVHFQDRKSKLKKNLAVQRKYLTATGGGTIKEIEKKVDSLEKEFGKGDSLMCRLFVRSASFLGGADRKYETGFAAANAIRESGMDVDPFKPIPKKRTLHSAKGAVSAATTRTRLENAKAFSTANSIAMKARASALFGTKPIRTSSLSSSDSGDESGLEREVPSKRRKIMNQSDDVVVLGDSPIKNSDRGSGIGISSSSTVVSSPSLSSFTVGLSTAIASTIAQYLSVNSINVQL